MKQITETITPALLSGATGYDPIEDRLRQNIRASIEALFEEELADVIGRCRYGRGGGSKKGYRHGHRARQLVGTFGTQTLSVPRARIEDEAGKITEWRSQALPRYQRLTKKAAAVIASVYLAGVNTRRVKRALFGLFQGAVSKDTGQPSLAKGKGRLGRVVCAQPCRGGDRPLDFGWHRDQDPAGPEGHEHLGARGHRCAPGRAEGAAFHQKHGRRKQGGLG